MGIRVEEMEPMTAEEIRRHRLTRPPEGHQREGFSFARMGGLDDPDEELALPGPDDVVEGNAVQLAPRPLGEPLRGRELFEAVKQHYLNWCRENRQFFRQRAAMLKATSPLQFSHMTQQQLEDYLTSDAFLNQAAEEKAKAACARAAKVFGWDEAQILDLVPTGHKVDERPKILLPGQEGR
jgi:hypothetical protein